LPPYPDQGIWYFIEMVKPSMENGKRLENKRRHITCYLAAAVSLITCAENFVVRAFCFLARGLAYLSVGQRSLAISDLKMVCESGNEIGCNELQSRFGTGF
jgi:hypothetical protein